MSVTQLSRDGGKRIRRRRLEVQGYPGLHSVLNLSYLSYRTDGRKILKQKVPQRNFTQTLGM